MRVLSMSLSGCEGWNGVAGMELTSRVCGTPYFSSRSWPMAAYRNVLVLLRNTTSLISGCNSAVTWKCILYIINTNRY